VSAKFSSLSTSLWITPIFHSPTFSTPFIGKNHPLDLQKTLNKSPGPMPKDFDFGRIEGMMLGLAIGDALGNTTEGKVPRERKARFGKIRGLPSEPTS
jgi:hypothetical protein